MKNNFKPETLNLKQTKVPPKEGFREAKSNLIKQIDKLDREIENMRLLIRDTHWDIQDKTNEKKQLFQQIRTLNSGKN